MPDEFIYTDKELFQKIAEGNESAFRQLFIAYTGILYPFVLKVVNTETWAEDIVQNIFTKIWANRRQLTEIENPGGYLYRMASNSALDYMKHHSVEVKAQYRIVRQYSQNDRNFTQEEMDSKLYDQLFKESIEQMPPQRRLVFLMKHQDGLNNDQIADKLNISKNTVRVHVAEALQSIRKFLIDKADLSLLILLGLMAL